MYQITLPVPTIAKPTHAGLSSDGPFGLPMINYTIEKGVEKGKWDRIELPNPTGPGVRKGDVIQYLKSDAPDGIAHVTSANTETAEVQWYFTSNSNPPETLNIDVLEYDLEYGHAKKISSNLSSQKMDFLTGKIDLFEDAQTPPNLSVDDLTLTREYNRDVVSKFLNHPSVGHVLGVNYPQSRATFAARYGGANGNIVALVELTYASASKLDGQKFIELKRYAAHPNRPENTGSWLISKALDWATLEAYEKCRSYCGIAENAGTLYNALEFYRSDGGETTTSSGDGWASAENRKNRSTWNDYERARFDKELLPTPRRMHRRIDRLDTEQNSQSDDLSLKDFGVTTTKKRTQTELDISDKSLTDNSPDLIFARRDKNPKKVLNAIEKFGNQIRPSVHITESLLTKKSTAVFAGITKYGIGVALVVGPPPEAEKYDFSKIQLYAYAASETQYPNNTASHLLGKARKWAGYQGYEKLTATPKPGTDIIAGIKQTSDAKDPSQTTQPIAP